MPIEQAKEAAKMVVETSGIFSAIWQWIVGGIGAGLIGLWGHITGRVKKLEETHVTSEQLRDHIDSEDLKFNALFEKADKMGDKLSNIAESVARIEGKLNK